MSIKWSATPPLNAGVLWKQWLAWTFSVEHTVDVQVLPKEESKGTLALLLIKKTFNKMGCLIK